MVILEAKVVDPTHLELSRPIRAARGGTVLVSVAESDDERTQWLAASAQGLVSAYGPDESDYSPDLLQKT